ncbi:MAG: DUF3363 domain-containing protein, partial [Burkholderiales bacterium]
LDGVDGKAYFVPMRSGTECDAPLGAVVEVRGATAVRAIDKSIAARVKDGVYRTSEHFARLAPPSPGSFAGGSHRAPCAAP